MTRAALLLALLVTACHDEVTRERIRNGDLSEENLAAARGGTPAPAAAAAAPGRIAEKTDLFSLTYEWPAEAAAIPALAARFKADAEADRKSLGDTAKEEFQFRAKEKLEYHPLEMETKWTSAGQSAALLSLDGSHYEYTGGAHPNHGALDLLWDRAAAKVVKVADLFEGPGGLERFLLSGWCKGLEVERLKRREGEKMEGPFGECPALTDAHIVPTDSDADGRFDKIMLYADPYVAGPYAEVDYEVDIPVSAAIIAGLKPAYRASFEAR